MPPPPGLGPFQLGLLLTALLAGGALWLAVRSVTRPIERLAAQIAEQGQELRPLVLRDDAGAEVAALVQAFNEAVGAVDLAQRQRQQLLAGLSHDLRTPLARLRMRVETQLQDHVPAPLQSALERDLQALQHMIDQFLHFVQGETAPRPGPPRALGLLLAEVLALFPDVHMAGTLPAALLERPLPETALRRLLVNLIDNAIAHGRAPVRVELGLDGERPRIAVADAGAGLDAAGFAQALQPFVRLAERSGGDGRGGHGGHCGLGLPIAAQMARQLGAELRCRPRNGGQAFAVELLLPAR